MSHTTPATLPVSTIAAPITRTIRRQTRLPAVSALRWVRGILEPAQFGASAGARDLPIESGVPAARRCAGASMTASH